jgi:CRP/FNR family transcriptional regulator
MRRSSNQRFAERKARTLFGQPVTDPLGHLNAHYPFPACLNERHLAKLKTSGLARSLSKGATLFREGERPTGIYVVLEGSAKLSVNSAQGKTMVLGLFGPGTILGLAAAVLGRTHAATAEVLRPTKVLFVPRKDLVREIRCDATAARQTAELVSEACYFTLDKMKTVDLSQSAVQKLARCLLGLVAHSPSGETPLKLGEETIAQMVGLSRETVSRLISRFRRDQIVNWVGSRIVIQDKRTLEKLADFSETENRDARTNA